MDPATIMAWITCGQMALTAGEKVYALFCSLIREIPGLDAEYVMGRIRPVDTSVADAAVDAEIGK